MLPNIKKKGIPQLILSKIEKTPPTIATYQNKKLYKL